MSSPPLFDYLLVGCGAVGAAVARELSRCPRAGGAVPRAADPGPRAAGSSVLVCEQNPEVLSEASSGNTGHMATNFYYTHERAPLEYRLTRRAAKINRGWLEHQVNVPRRRCGLLFLALTLEELNELKRMQQIGKENGEEEVDLLSRDEVLQLEPHLKCPELLKGGLISRSEFVVDSWLLAASHLYVALKRGGCQLRKSCHVEKISKDEEQGLWRVDTSRGQYLAKVVINCAGNYSDEIHDQLAFASPPASSSAFFPAGAGTASNRAVSVSDPFKIRPGKGEFLVLKRKDNMAARDSSIGDNSNLLVKNMVVRAPSKLTAGPYVFQSVYSHLVVGPTNVYQDSKSDRSCDPERIRQLRDHLEQLFPESLNHYRPAYQFSGLRPASTGHKDYQIRFGPDWVTLGAIRSTGLTACGAIAEYVVRKLVADSDLASNSDSLAHDADLDEENVGIDEDPVMPAPVKLADGSIKIGDYEFKDCHPLSWRGIFDEIGKEDSTVLETAGETNPFL